MISRGKMKFLLHIFMVILAAIMDPRDLKAQRALPSGTVHVEVFGPFGSPIQNATVRLLAADRSRKIAEAEMPGAIPQVPYGRYLLVVSDKGGAVGEREVALNCENLWVRIGLPFPGGDRAWPAGDLTISGNLDPVPATVRGWWVRIEGIFLHISREAPVVAAGRFSVSGLDMGTYLVEIFEGGKLRHVETIEIDPNQPTTHLKVKLSELLQRDEAPLRRPHQ
jgi:hypothetical protein